MSTTLDWCNREPRLDELLLQFVEDQGAWPSKSRLLFFLGACGQKGDASYGKMMRSLVVKLVHQSTFLQRDYADDIFVHCNEDKNLPVQVRVIDVTIDKVYLFNNIQDH